MVTPPLNGQPQGWEQRSHPVARKILGQLADGLDDDHLAISEQRIVGRMVDRQADKWMREQETAVAAGERKIVPFGELASRPKPREIVPGLLTAGFYGLAGPPEVGKSLWLRDLACQVAATGRYVLYAMSEGQHDVVERFQASPLYSTAVPYLAVTDDPLNLGSRADVDWLAQRCGAVDLVIFDMIYGFGLPDDTGVGDVAPVIGGCKRLAALASACVLVTGHPGLAQQRRFRGSSMWRGAFDGEFHMNDGRFTAEKHKYFDKKAVAWPYTVSFPHIVQLSEMGTLDRTARNMAVIAEHTRVNPGLSARKRAELLAPQMGLSAEAVRKLIPRKDAEDD